MTSLTNFQSYFHVFRDIIRAVHSSNSVQEVLDVVVTKSSEVLNAKGALLRIFNRVTNRFEVRAACGMGERYLSKGPVTTEKLLSDLSEQHKVHIITDIFNDPRVEYPQQKWDEGVRMMLDVPLAIENEMLGLLRIYLTKQREFSDDELDFIITVAEQCTCCIQRIQLIEKQQVQFNHLATQVDKMSSLGRMAAGIAHEINNPLTGILLYSSNMRKKIPKSEPLEEGLDIIIKESQRCKRIIEGLLNFSRDQEPQKVPADINNIIESALGILENEFRLRHARLIKHLGKEMVQTAVDENQIEQVFINLLLNALQAVDVNGLVTVKSDVDKKRNTIRIEISDNGNGIAPDDIQKIFEPFFSTKSNGTGLGLSVSYGIIKNHEGEIWVSSEPDTGTQFIIELPILKKNLKGEEIL